MDKNNRKLKLLLYKCIKAIMHKIIPVPYGSIYHQLKYSSPNCSKNKQARTTQKSLPFGKWRFKEKEVRIMDQKQKRIRQKEQQV